MTKYEPGDIVEVWSESTWTRGVVIGEKFNGGNGGYYVVEFDNGGTVIRSARNMRSPRGKS